MWIHAFIAYKVKDKTLNSVFMSGLFSMESAQLEIKQKHNKLLVDLCDLICIHCQSYKNFVGYLHNADLPARRLQCVQAEPMEVFHLMEERGILKEGDYSTLEKALDASGHQQALELVKKVGSKITKLMEAMQESSAAADGSLSNKKKSGIQESSTDADGSLSNKKKSAILESSTAAYDSPSNKKKSSDDKDFYVEETDTTAASKDITPSPQPVLLFQSKSQSVHVAAVIPQLPLIDPSSAQFISSGQQPSAGRSDLVPFGASQGQGRNTAVLQDEMEFFEAIRNNNTQKIEQMIRIKKIPKRSAIETVVKQYGYSKNIQIALREMSNLLREIPESVGVWCGYKPNDPNNPVFVVTLKNQNCILKKTEVLELFTDYSIIIQYKYIPNDEERNIEKQYGSTTIRSEDVARLNNCIAAHTESLMNEHSNLSIIRACPVKSRGYLRNQMDVIEKPCIVLNVPVKGIIPVGEKEFPTEIDGIVTDVREGEFYLFGGHNANEYHQKLRMGCCISGGNCGTLGGFVDLPDGKIGCLTTAHVVLDQNLFHQYITLNEQEKRIMNNNLARGMDQIKIYQPEPEPGSKDFGKVHAIAIDAGNNLSPSVDAAIIEITDDERKPEMGNFPDGDFEDAGFTTDDPMFYASGKILDDIHSSQRGSLVIKYGCTTGITRGCLEWMGNSVRPVNLFSYYSYPVIWGQLEVKSNTFAAPGDSGALVFLCLGGNIRHLRAVGMFIGQSSTGCQSFITPIKAVFEKLGLKDNRFKVFPRRKLSQQQPSAQPLIEPTNMTQHLTMVEQNIKEYMNERFATVEQSINQRLLMAEQNITENLNERFIRIEQNMNENVNGRFNRLEDLLNHLIH